MPSARPDYATEMAGAGARAEIIDPTTGQVWQTLDGCDLEAFGRLDLPAPFQPVGVGTPAMDENWFDRSPGAAENGPMDCRSIAGRRWGYCASPASGPSKPFGDEGPTEMQVDKHHALRFAAGRRVPVLKSPEGETFVHVIAGRGFSDVIVDPRAKAASFVVPTGWRIGEVEIAEDWVLRLPNPTRVFFFPTRDSFQGPIDSLPGEWEERT